MRSHIVACGSGLLLAAVIPMAGAQTQFRDGVTATQIQRSAGGTPVAGLVNEGAGFQLICRGGPGLRIGISDQRLASNGPTSWFQVATMTVDFNRSTQPPDRAGRHLQPGQCSPADFPLRDFDPARIQDTIRMGDPRAWDASAGAAERRPDTESIPQYLKDPNHYWSFSAGDLGEGYLQAGESRYWKPDFYKGPAASTTLQSVGTVAAMTGASTTTTLAASRIDALGGRTEGHAGAPAVPSPVPAPPIAEVPAPAAPIVFSPPLLEDNAQLWACADAAAGEADAGACSGEESAQAYCGLRDAQSVPDLLIADAQPGSPVRAVNGDVCQDAGPCRVVSQLQCDR